MKIWSHLRTAFTIGCIFISPQFALAQETRLPLAQVPQAVENLLSDGQPRAALEIAIAANKADPANPNFLIAIARAYTALADYDAAIAAGNQAWSRSGSNGLKFVAANTVAAAHTKASNFSRAQFWLRRARQYAPDAQRAEQVAKDYRTLARRNPLAASLRFGIAPSSNINNGSANDTASLFGFPGEFTLNGEARALSGYQLSMAGNMSLRLSQSETSLTTVAASFNKQTYILSEGARVQAPDANGSDYSSTNATVGLKHRQIFSEGLEPTDFSLTYGRIWSGGDPSAHYAEAAVSQGFAINPQAVIITRLSANNRKSKTGQPEIDTFKASATYRQRYANSDVFSFGVTVTEARSDMPDSDYAGVRLSSNYDIAQSFAGMRFGVGLDFERRNYDASIYNPGPREDRYGTLRLSVEFSELEFYGFRPVMNIEASRNLSTVDLFDRDYSSIGFDLRSSF